MSALTREQLQHEPLTLEQLEQRESAHLSALFLFSGPFSDRAVAGWGGFDLTEQAELDYWCRFARHYAESER